MSAFEKMSDHDERTRATKDGEYTIVAAGGVGRIVCYRKGLRLIDFYSSTVVPGSSRMNSEVAGKSERDKQMEESPPVMVNPPISK